MRILVIVAAVVSLASCVTDPDAAARDQAEAQAREIAGSLELPPGYEVLEIALSGAQTPKENRGGGQGGHFTVVFRPLERVAPSEVMADFDTWLTGQGMARATGYAGRDVCNDGLVTAEWADSEKVVALSYSVNGRQHVLIPFGFAGIVTQQTSAIETGVPLQECPDA